MNHQSRSLKRGFLVKLEAILGKEAYSLAERDLLSYSRDANFRSAIKAHYSEYEETPQVIVWPNSTIQVSQLIKLAKQYQIPVIPYGGGSGVCAGAMSPEGNGGILLDLKRMQKLLRVDEKRLFAEAECGIYGLQLEKELERRGFTLGHFPSSILVATLGGYLAARSAGQLSSKYGKMEDLIIDFEFVDGLGRIQKTSNVNLTKGLDMTQAIIGSEGTLGIITKARFKIFPKPAEQIFRAFRFPKIEYGMEALRRIMQTGMKPDVLRLYDELDTLLMLSKKSAEIPSPITKFIKQKVKETTEPLKEKIMKAAFRAHRLINTFANFSNSGCVLIVMLEGDLRLIQTQCDLIEKICKDMDAKADSSTIAHHWYEHRYSVAFKAPKLFQDGAFTDTMEVATTWSNLENLYHHVIKAMRSHALVFAHISHVYAEGAAIYFTFVIPMTGLSSSLKKFDFIWQKALQAVQEQGGVVSHHHGIGRLKSAFIRQEWGNAIKVFQKLKDFFDPNEILNPNVLIPHEVLDEAYQRENQKQHVTTR